MRHLSRTWVRTTAAAVAAAGLAVLATSAVVGAQSSTEVIHACADSRGSLRMIPATGACAAGLQVRTSSGFQDLLGEPPGQGAVGDGA
jgi:hypothetical protein